MKLSNSLAICQTGDLLNDELPYWLMKSYILLNFRISLTGFNWSETNFNNKKLTKKTMHIFHVTWNLYNLILY